MATKSGKETGAALNNNEKSATRRSRRQAFDKKISGAKDKRMQTYYEVYNVLKKDAGAALPYKVKGEGFDALVAKKLKKETGAALNADEKAAIKKLTGFDNKKDFIKYKYGMNQGGSVKMKAKGYSRGGAPMGMAPPGKKVPAMKTRGYAKGGAAMKTKGAAKGGARKPSSKNSGLYGRR